MAGSTDFVPFATGSNANVQDQADYLSAASTSTGFQSGTAQSAMLNKVWRQSSFVAAGVATFMAQTLGANIADDGNLSEFVDNLTAALQELAASIPHGVQALSGSGTFTVPAGVYTIMVERWGGGGGGGGANPSMTGTGGGGGAYGCDMLSVTPGQQIAYACGAGGTAGSPSTAGGAGAQTTFGSLVAVPGGSGGGSSSTSGGSGGVAPSAAIGIPGGDGAGGFMPSLLLGGQGGDSSRAGQGGVQANGNPGNPGKGWGAGGGGAGATSSQSNNGAQGQAGAIVVSW